MRALDLRGLENKISFKETRIRELAKEDPTFPQPVKLGGRKNCWLESEVDAWLAAQFSTRTSTAKGRG